MSYGEEMAAEAEAYLGYIESAVKESAKSAIWETKDGRKIPIEKMTDAHLDNTISYLERKDTIDLWLPWIMRLKEERDRRTRLSRQETIEWRTAPTAEQT